MKKEDPKTKSILTPPPPSHTGQANPNKRAQANTLSASAKPLSPFKPKSAVKQSQTKPVPQTQTEPLPKSQTNPNKRATPNLNLSRRQFIEQYGAYALVTPVALYAMMSPNRATAQAGSTAVVVTRPRVLNDQDKIETFDITTKTEGEVTPDGDPSLRQGDKYTTPDDIGSSDQVMDDAVDDIVAATRPKSLGGSGGNLPRLGFSHNQPMAQAGSEGVVADRPTPLIDGDNDDDNIDLFGINTHTDGHIDGDGDLTLERK